jgi:hypothetical protein
MNRDIFSIGEAQFMAFANAFNRAAVCHAELLGIPSILVGDNTEKLAAYAGAYRIAGEANAGRLDRKDRAEKRAALTRNMQKIKRAYIDADPREAATPDIVMAFGLPCRSDTRTSAPDPTEVAAFSLHNGGYLQIIVRHPARPPRCIGALAFYRVGGGLPATYKELTNSTLLTRPRQVLCFEETELGQTLYIVLRWENKKGRLGPPSPIQSHVIA